MRLCIIAGSGNLPQDIAKEAKNRGTLTSIICIKSFANENSFKEYGEVDTISLGNVGQALKFLKKHKISHILFAGSVKRPSFLSIIPDFEGTKLLSYILKEKVLGDDTLLKSVISFFEKRGFKIISPNEILTLNIKESGSLTKLAPNIQALKDIEIGASANRYLSSLDVGQAIIVSEGRIISIEAAEGTDEMIRRSKEYTEGQTTLIKLPKLNQDVRIDMPTIGPKTIELMSQNNISGIAIDKTVLILSVQETIDKADLLGIYIYVIEGENK